MDPTQKWQLVIKACILIFPLFAKCLPALSYFPLFPLFFCLKTQADPLIWRCVRDIWHVWYSCTRALLNANTLSSKSKWSLGFHTIQTHPKVPMTRVDTWVLLSFDGLASPKSATCDWSKMKSESRIQYLSRPYL